jgi:hypothetical protein
MITNQELEKPIPYCKINKNFLVLKYVTANLLYYLTFPSNCANLCMLFGKCHNRF